jgi:hypothetical protein
MEAALNAWDRKHPHAAPYFGPRIEPERQKKVEDAFRTWKARVN